MHENQWAFTQNWWLFIWIIQGKCIVSLSSHSPIQRGFWLLFYFYYWITEKKCEKHTFYINLFMLIFVKLHWNQCMSIWPATQRIMFLKQKSIALATPRSWVWLLGNAWTDQMHCLNALQVVLDKRICQMHECKSLLYSSCVHQEKDINSGLIGPMLICSPGTLRSRVKLQPDVTDFFLLFTTFDERKSWYLDYNIGKFCTPPCQAKVDDPWFEMSNKFAGTLCHHLWICMHVVLKITR